MNVVRSRASCTTHKRNPQLQTPTEGTLGRRLNFELYRPFYFALTRVENPQNCLNISFNETRFSRLLGSADFLTHAAQFAYKMRCKSVSGFGSFIWVIKLADFKMDVITW